MTEAEGASLDVARLRRDVVGANYGFRTPFGTRRMLYADYVASGRCVGFIEAYLSRLQACYGNTHTEDDFTGKTMTGLLHQAEERIKRSVGGTERTRLVAVGTGSTGAIHKFQEMIGVSMPPVTRARLRAHLDALPDAPREAAADLERRLAERRPVVFIGPYEHHSNEVTWRESLAEVVAVALTADGGLDLEDLERKVSDPRYAGRLKIGSFSAASNVTGIVTPTYDVARILHRHGVLACFDYAASAPYVEIDMNRDPESRFDAIFLSPHKLLGGPGSSGLLIFDESLYRCDLPPTCGGGGTVDYVNAEDHDYTADIEDRERAGTPGTFQVMRAALALELKDALGVEWIEERERALLERCMSRLAGLEGVEVLGNPDPARRIAVVAFLVRHGDRYLHPKLVTQLLNDLFGIQSRAGCACAGPYGHRLLGIGRDLSLRYREQTRKGHLGLKPGWARISLHFTMDEADVDYIGDAIEFVATHGHAFVREYTFDLASGAWTHERDPAASRAEFGLESALAGVDLGVPLGPEADKASDYALALDEARARAAALEADAPPEWVSLPSDLEELSFFYVTKLAE